MIWLYWTVIISRRSSSGSLVNCDVYCIFRASAFSLESLLVTLPGLRKGMLHTFSSLLPFYIGIYILGLGVSVMLMFKMLSM